MINVTREPTKGNKQAIGALCCLLIFGLACRQRYQFALESSFGLGTNGSIAIVRELPVPGYYEFTLEFQDVDRKKFLAHKWPLEMPVNLHIAVRADGQSVMDTNISKAYFSHINDKRRVAAYSLPGFWISNRTTMDCRVADSSTVSQMSPARLVLFKAVAK